MDVVATLILVFALIISYYYWKKFKERDVFWLMILALLSLIVKGWRIIENKYFEFPELIQNTFFAIRTLLSIAIVLMVVKVLFFRKKKEVMETE